LLPPFGLLLDAAGPLANAVIVAANGRAEILLSKPFYLCCKVRIATDPVGRVSACQIPDLMIRLGLLRISHSPLGLVADNALSADLGCEHFLGCFLRGSCDRTGSLVCGRRAGEDEDKRKQEHEMSARSHGATIQESAMSTQRLPAGPATGDQRTLVTLRCGGIPSHARQNQICFAPPEFGAIDLARLCENGRPTQLTGVASKAQSFHKKRAAGPACRFCIDGQ
jgi:hypothetical protein